MYCASGDGDRLLEGLGVLANGGGFVIEHLVDEAVEAEVPMNSVNGAVGTFE